jgi:hypothetical protein
VTDAFVPSLIIVVSTSVAFAIGRLIGWATRRRARFVRVGVVLISLWSAGVILMGSASRYALLLPLALTIGCFSYGRRDFAPGVFKDR